MPSLTTVTLDKEDTFKYKESIHTKSSSLSPPSFLDITPALQEYLSFPLSFKHHYTHIHIHSLFHKETPSNINNSTSATNTNTTTSLTESPTSEEKDTPQPAGRARSRSYPLHIQMTPNADCLRISTPSKQHGSRRAAPQTKSSHFQYSPP